MTGLGHPIHEDGELRTARLYTPTAEHAVLGLHLRLTQRIQIRATSPLGAALPLNAGGACGAVLCDLGVDTPVLCGVAVMSRAAGVVGHLAEEARAPMGRTIWYRAEQEATYWPRR